MSEKKHIDKLFKEQLKNFEVAPSDAVWENIEATLNKDKRKRRVIPIWWKIAGVAATLLLMFTVANIVLNNSDSAVEKEVVETEKTNDNSTNDDAQTNGSELNTSEDLEHHPIVGSENTSEEQDGINNAPQNNLTPSNKSKHKTGVATSEEKEKQENNIINETHKDKSIIKNKSLQRNAVVSNKNKTLKNNKDNSQINNTNKNAIIKNSNEAVSQNEELNNDIKKEQSEIDKLIKQTKSEKSTQVTSSNSSEKENSETLIDSSKTKELDTTENAIEKAIAQTENEDNEKTKDSINPLLKRWSIAPNMAPVYFNTLGSGSPIDEQFVNNTKEGDINLSYGIKGAYAINKKFTIRAGINKVNLGYSTNNVVAFNNPNSSASSREFQNVTISDSTTTYLSANSLSFATGPEVLFIKEQGSISQQLGFIEVPIELEYNVLDKKIGLNLIGGFSTLFLSDNDVYSVENNGNKTRLGEASNINDMSYSANFGIGINYNISKQLRFNLEPTFKYQINTFNDTSGNFQPFFIGVYTGLSFKF